MIYWYKTEYFNNNVGTTSLDMLHAMMSQFVDEMDIIGHNLLT